MLNYILCLGTGIEITTNNKSGKKENMYTDKRLEASWIWKKSSIPSSFFKYTKSGAKEVEILFPVWHQVYNLPSFYDINNFLTTILQWHYPCLTCFIILSVVTKWLIILKLIWNTFRMCFSSTFSGYTNNLCSVFVILWKM